MVEQPKNLSNEEILSIFAEDFKEEDIGKTTQASAISVGDVKEISLHKISPMEIERYLWLHPAVPRGIQIKANRMTARSYNIDGVNAKAVDYCKKILENSGGSTGINQWIQDTMAFGDGYRTLVPNTDGTEIIKLSDEHPIYFDINRVESDKSEKNIKYTDLNYDINQKTKTPNSYTQLEWSKVTQSYQPTGEPIPADKVAHLIFDKWGDEVKGISLIQYVHLTIKYLLNMEEAAAETIWRNGFTQKKVTTNIRTEKDLRQMASNLVSLRSRDVVVLPEGSDVNNLVPGTSEFPAYHEVFLELIAIRLGIPKSLLLMSGTSTNKATLDSMLKDMRDDLAMDELTVKQCIENQIFKPACQLKFGEDFKDIPLFSFNSVQTDKDTIIEQYKNTSTYTVQLVNAASVLSSMGREKESEKLIEYLMKSIDKDYKLGEKKVVEEKQDDRAKKLQPENTGVPPAFKELKTGSNTKD